jgi:hypothetical protein
MALADGGLVANLLPAVVVLLVLLLVVLLVLLLVVLLVLLLVLPALPALPVLPVLPMLPAPVASRIPVMVRRLLAGPHRSRFLRTVSAVLREHEHGNARA